MSPVEENQKLFDSFPEEDPLMIKTHNEDEAYVINRAMNMRAQEALGGGNIKTTQKIIEHPDCFEVDGIFIAKENLGEPMCPDVVKNPKKFDMNIPQAWEYCFNETTEYDGFRGFELWKRAFPWNENMTKKEAEEQELYPCTTWQYNNLGGITEGRYHGVWVPINEKQLVLLCTVPGDAIEKAKTLYIPLAGRYNAKDGKFSEVGVCANLGSSSIAGGETDYTYLSRGDNQAKAYYSDRFHGFSVRPFLNKPTGTK